MRINSLLASCLALAGCGAVSTTADVKDIASTPQWLEPVPPELGGWYKWEEIPSSLYFEVVASKLYVAQHDLAKSPFLQLEHNSTVTYYGGRGFQCEAPAKAYLLRALYSNGGTGGFTLHWADSSLIVGHGSLGPGGAVEQSALVACLNRAPTVVYSVVSGAL
jgi:hypothetical protein